MLAVDLVQAAQTMTIERDLVDETRGPIPNLTDLHARWSEVDGSSADLDTQRVAGSTRFRMIEADHLRAEIGFTFLAASYQRTHVNTVAKLLMLEHAFETWGTNRVELLTDFVNERERRARTLNQLVKTLVDVVDKRDPFAARHSTRVAHVARAVAKEMNLSDTEIETADIAGNLLNLGKIMIPPEVLAHPGRWEFQ